MMLKTNCRILTEKELSSQSVKRKTIVVEKKLTKEEFVTVARKQICKFLEHVHRGRTQYAAENKLKENVPQGGHVMPQMDFAENKFHL